MITAAAGGIGRATAEIMLDEGATVIGVDKGADQLAALADARRNGAGDFHPHVADALQEDEVRAAVEDSASRFGRIDILVNGVGGSTIIPRPGAHADELTFAEWQQVVNFNLNATFLFSHTVIPVMKNQGAGKIVNISSLAYRGRTEGASTAYSAAKAGLNAFTTKLALEVGPHGINVNAVAPSFTLTERMASTWETMSDEQRQATVQRVPLRRMADASDTAKVVCFLASDDAAYVSGVAIDVTGGM
jgi:NAD(P)-dependent dehydrogenase (short-subunit alcohol dehydrogenase family)